MTNLSKIIKTVTSTPIRQRIKPCGAIKIDSGPLSDTFTLTDKISVLKNKYSDFFCLTENITLHAKKEKYLDVRLKMAEYKELKSIDGSISEFCDDFEKIADHMTEKGLVGTKNVASIIYSQIIKVKTELREHKKVIGLCEKAINIYNQNGDNIHKLGRIQSIKEAYEALGEKNKVYEYTKLALDCTEEILANYEKTVKKYNSLTNIIPPRKNILREKAYLQTELAAQIAHKKRNKAIKYLSEAREIYKSLDINVRFIDRQFKRVKQSPMPNKLQQYSKEEIVSFVQAKRRRKVKTESPELIKNKSYYYMNYDLVCKIKGIEN